MRECAALIGPIKALAQDSAGAIVGPIKALLGHFKEPLDELAHECVKEAEQEAVTEALRMGIEKTEKLMEKPSRINTKSIRCSYCGCTLSIQEVLNHLLIKHKLRYEDVVKGKGIPRQGEDV